MSQSFSFSFGGDDIENDPSESIPSHPFAAETGTLSPRPTSSINNNNSAFPTGSNLLPALAHDLPTLLSSLPSKIVYSTLAVTLDDGSVLKIPRRELWDVRVQLMAEDDDVGLGNLGADDVKTGVYEGGFKSWESAVDLVRVLAARAGDERNRSVLEMGCGTALPTLALLQWHLSAASTASEQLQLAFADYNPAVLQLVTVPNIVLSWAQLHFADGWEEEGELELGTEVLDAFRASLRDRGLELRFFSGAWSREFVQLVVQSWGEVQAEKESGLLVLAAETIYSPVALRSFADTLMLVLQAGKGKGKGSALVGAKKVYFGVGGSMEDFRDVVMQKGAKVEQVREEVDGVRRAVVEVSMA